MGKLRVYCLKTLKKLSIYPLGNTPSAPSDRLAPDPICGMYVLCRAYRSDGSPMGAIIPLYHLHQPLQLIPKFGEKADPTLTSQTSFNVSCDFYLNHYFDKEDFIYMKASLAI